MTARKILPRLLPLSLVVGLGAIAPACDGGKETPAPAKKEAPKKEEAKADASEKPAPAEEKPAEMKAEDEKAAAAEEKPAEAAAEEKPAEAAAEEKPAEEPPAAEEKPAEEKPAEPAKAAAKPKPKPKADPKPKPKAEPKPEPKAEPAVAKADGKAIYMKKCKNCHGVSGAADTKIAAKNDIASWKEPGWKGKWTVAKIKNIVANGKAGTKMKSFKSKLTADEIEAVSMYSRSLGK
ncbi:MAG: cytochrome c [Myxococcota bacterium]